MRGTVAVSGAVLAGGSSRRMGTDKRWLEIDGVALLRRTAEAVAAVAADVHVIAASAADAAAVEERLAGLGASLDAELSIEADARRDQGPLAGIETALGVARHEVVVVLATDHPFVPPALLNLLVEQLVREPDRLAVAIVADGRSQPLVAAYRRAARQRVSAALDAGQRRAQALLEELDASMLGPEVWAVADPHRRSGLDIDTPADLRRARQGRQVVPQLARHRSRTTRVLRVRSGDTVACDDSVVGEDPLEIRAAGPGQQPRTVMTTMRTRGHDEDLAVGWLFGEGLLRASGVAGIEHADPLALAQPEDQITVHLTHPLAIDDVAHRHAAATASCGVCGRASIDELAARAAVIDLASSPPEPVAWSRLAELPDRLRAGQQLFATTGGIHATGLFDDTGELVTLREDVGRHNALDAAIGDRVRHGDSSLGHLVAVLSGRIGFELVAKAAVAGIPLIAAVGAPSALAVRSAERFGITLVGFLRGGDGNVYTHPARVDPHG